MTENTYNTKGPNRNDPIWIDDFQILFRQDRLSEFFPSNLQSLSEKINAFSRLIIYISVIISFYQKNIVAIQYGIFLLIVIYFLWRNQTIVPINCNSNSPSQELEQFTAEKVTDASGMLSLVPTGCQVPTPENPFGNRLFGDSPLRSPACTTPGMQQMAQNMLQGQLYMDIDDLYSKRSNDRLFRTMPNTDSIPDREKYARWLIGNEPNCKLDGNCDIPTDLRFEQRNNQLEMLPGFIL
jgi:hypothetical protein